MTKSKKILYALLISSGIFSVNFEGTGASNAVLLQMKDNKFGLSLTKLGSDMISSGLENLIKVQKDTRLDLNALVSPDFVKFISNLKVHDPKALDVISRDVFIQSGLDDEKIYSELVKIAKQNGKIEEADLIKNSDLFYNKQLFNLDIKTRKLSSSIISSKEMTALGAKYHQQYGKILAEFLVQFQFCNLNDLNTPLPQSTFKGMSGLVEYCSNKISALQLTGYEQLIADLKDIEVFIRDEETRARGQANNFVIQNLLDYGPNQQVIRGCLKELRRLLSEFQKLADGKLVAEQSKFDNTVNNVQKFAEKLNAELDSKPQQLGQKDNENIQFMQKLADKIEAALVGRSNLGTAMEVLQSEGNGLDMQTMVYLEQHPEIVNVLSPENKAAYYKYVENKNNNNQTVNLSQNLQELQDAGNFLFKDQKVQSDGRIKSRSVYQTYGFSFGDNDSKIQYTLITKQGANDLRDRLWEGIQSYLNNSENNMEVDQATLELITKEIKKEFYKRFAKLLENKKNSIKFGLLLNEIIAIFANDFIGRILRKANIISTHGYCSEMLKKVFLTLGSLDLEFDKNKTKLNDGQKQFSLDFSTISVDFASKEECEQRFNDTNPTLLVDAIINTFVLQGYIKAEEKRIEALKRKMVSDIIDIRKDQSSEINPQWFIQEIQKESENDPILVNSVRADLELMILKIMDEISLKFKYASLDYHKYVALKDPFSPQIQKAMARLRFKQVKEHGLIPSLQQQLMQSDLVELEINRELFKQVTGTGAA